MSRLRRGSAPFTIRCATRCASVGGACPPR
jgi:hypothetical protein